MLGIYRFKQLAGKLSVSENRLAAVLGNADSYVRELLLHDPRKPDKPREVIDVVGSLRVLQNRIYKRVLLPKLVPSPHSHGSVTGSSIKTNVAIHEDSSFVFKADIENFYPSVKEPRVRMLFMNQLQCPAKLAEACTKLCTYRGHLALGLVTSPILADRVLYQVDKRISAACKSMGLAYSRYVDDITISGCFDLEKSGVQGVIERILTDHGFNANPEKHIFGPLACIPITGIRLRNGKMDVSSEYATELERQLDDALSLASGGPHAGPYFTENQLRGRVNFVSWINRGRRGHLRRRLGVIDWSRYELEGLKRGLVAEKKRFERIA